MTDPTTPPPARNFNTFIAQVQDGAFHAELSDKLRELIGDLSNHKASYGGKAIGTMTIKLGFTLDAGVVEIMAKAETTTPKAPTTKTIMWVTPENNLTGANPKQAKLPFRDVTVGGNEAASA